MTSTRRSSSATGSRCCGSSSHIAQFDTPEAILTNPADDFVSGFVGAGAALKRLNLTRVREVEMAEFPTVTVDDPLQSIFNKLRAGSHNELLLLDRRNRPYKWLRRGDLMRVKGSLARAGQLVHDTVTRDATLRDALEAVLTDSGGRVAVTGRRGEYIGVVDMETLMNSVHEMLEADRLAALEHQHEQQEQHDRRTTVSPGTPSTTSAPSRATDTAHTSSAANKSNTANTPSTRSAAPWRAAVRTHELPHAPRGFAGRPATGRARRQGPGLPGRGGGAHAAARRRRNAGITWQKLVTPAARRSPSSCWRPTCGSPASNWTRSPGTPWRNGNVALRLWQHIQLTAISTFWVLIIAIPLGIALTRRGLSRAAPPCHRAANIGQATPAIGLLALLVIWLGIGPRRPPSSAW